MLRRFIRGERGQSTTEYVLLLALIVVPIALLLHTKFRFALRDLLDTLNQLVIGPGV